MMKDDELWLKKIKERLDDYSEPLPDAGWERLEKALPTSAPMSVVGTKKKILFRRWAMTAAAVALVESKLHKPVCKHILTYFI